MINLDINCNSNCTFIALNLPIQEYSNSQSKASKRYVHIGFALDVQCILALFLILQMARGLVGFDSQASGARVSNVGWLQDSSSDLVTTITKRIEMITELELYKYSTYDNITFYSSDDLQVSIE